MTFGQADNSIYISDSEMDADFGRPSDATNLSHVFFKEFFFSG